MSEEQQPHPDPSTTLAPIGHVANLPDVLANLGSEDAQFWCSFSPQTPAERIRIYNALSGDTDGFLPNVNVDLSIENVSVRVSDETDKKTGEQYRKCVTALFLSDGRVIAGSSLYVARSIQSLLASGIRPPFVPPLIARIVQIPTTEGRSMLRLKVVGFGPDPSTEKRGSGRK